MDLHASTCDQLAAVLKGRRHTLGLSQRDTGSQVGLLQKTVSALETDPSGSSITSLYRLLSALDLELVLRPKTSNLSSDNAPEW